MSKRTLILAVTGFAFSVAACGSYGTSVVEGNKAPARVASVSLTVPASLVTGQTARARAIPKDANGATLPGRAISWFTSSASIASVTDSGLVSAVAPGSAVVSAVSEGVSGQATIGVVPPTPTPIATVTVAVSPPSILIGQTAHATATLKDSTGAPIVGRPVTWQSSNSNVAAVAPTGDVTAVATGTAMISATSEGKSASSALSVTAAPPVPVASVSVALVSSSLNPGQTTQATATMRDANGTVLNGRVVTWSSANTNKATVNSASGLVTAVDTGTAQINATSEGKSGSAVLTVSSAAPPPPPPPPGTSNEPSGMTLIDERPFNSLAEHAAPHVPAWDTDVQLTIQQDATAPKSPSSVIRMTLPTGFAGGSSNGHMGVVLPTYRVLYIAYWSKYSPNWQGHLTGVNKHVYAWTGGHPPFVFEAEGTGSGSLKPRPVIQSWALVGAGNYNPNLVPGAVYTRGQWDYTEIVLTGNTAGKTDGSMDWFLNGVHVGSVGGLQWTAGTTGWNVFELYPVWGGVGDVVSSTQWMEWDHVYLSGKN